MKYTRYSMKLQKRVNRRVGDKEYVKWYVNIPASTLEKAGMKEGAELEVVVKGKKLVLQTKED